MPRYLYQFGYESLIERDANERSGSDFESCGAIFIDADNEDAAMAWGREVSQAFVAWLFDKNPPVPDWKAQQFAYWIDNEDTALDVDCETVRVGEMPDFTKL